MRSTQPDGILDVNVECDVNELVCVVRYAFHSKQNVPSSDCFLSDEAFSCDDGVCALLCRAWAAVYRNKEINVERQRWRVRRYVSMMLPAHTFQIRFFSVLHC